MTFFMETPAVIFFWLTPLITRLMVLKLGHLGQNLLRDIIFRYWPKMEGVKNGKISISREGLVVRSSLTPHFMQNMHISISVSYKLYFSDQQKSIKVTF